MRTRKQTYLIVLAHTSAFLSSYNFIFNIKYNKREFKWTFKSKQGNSLLMNIFSYNLSREVYRLLYISLSICCMSVAFRLMILSGTEVHVKLSNFYLEVFHLAIKLTTPTVVHIVYMLKGFGIVHQNFQSLGRKVILWRTKK